MDFNGRASERPTAVQCLVVPPFSRVSSTKYATKTDKHTVDKSKTDNINPLFFKKKKSYIS